jgi:hypothetical protein
VVPARVLVWSIPLKNNFSKVQSLAIRAFLDLKLKAGPSSYFLQLGRSMEAKTIKNIWSVMLDFFMKLDFLKTCVNGFLNSGDFYV